MICGSLSGAEGMRLGDKDYWATWGITDHTALEMFHRDGNFSIGMMSSGARIHDEGHLFHHSRACGTTIVFYGNLFNARELAKDSRLATNGDEEEALGPLLLSGYEEYGSELFRKLNGNFVAVIHDPRHRRLWVARDHLGVEPLFFCRKGGTLFFSSHLHPLARHPEVEAALNPAAVVRYLLMNYNMGQETFFQGVFKLRPGHLLRVEGERQTVSPYWYLSYREKFRKTVDDYRDELLDLTRSAVRLRLDTGRFRTGAHLSGGIDSSSVVCLMRQLTDRPLHTFSFRCQAKTYDESHYARLMSDRCGTIHCEVPYDAEDARRVSKVIDLMPEPFCDIGIEVATFLLGERGAGVVDYVLTGDGGDELFAGHPVYLADLFAGRFSRIPPFLWQPLARVMQQLPDSDKKLGLVVKAKRFSYSAAFPAELYSNRWRIYYTRRELQKLLTPEWAGLAADMDPLQEVRSLYREADGNDFLSTALYGDYYTVVDFSLRRLQLLRHFGLEGRFPLLDHRLVEYGARIPSELKINGHHNTKVLFHEVMEGTLPDEIVHRKDKLGHSVPFKNWIRHAPALQGLMEEVLSPRSLSRRHIFNPERVRELYQRHLRREDNNSHRLWALLVLELWCRKNLDQKVVEPPKEVVT
ncbi:MAG: hypothetical protein HY548_06020 [Elusimicrobia bacterium]|nr:hypothetical protein [Elusimicrobiota bacterium]